MSAPAQRHDAIEDSYPLSSMQQGMVFHHLYASHSGVDVEQIVCTLRERVDPDSFRSAWERILERHAVFRTSFRWEGLAEPLQDVHRRVDLPWHFEDCSDASPGDQERRIEAFLTADRLRGFDLTTAPLTRFAVFRLGPEDYRFVWTFHHALLDGRSFPVVLQEAFAFYEAARHGRDLTFETPRPYREYIEWLGRQDFGEARGFWTKLLEGFDAPTRLSIETAAQSDPWAATGYGEEEEEQELRLSEAVTSALRSRAGRHGVTVNTLVQGAWAYLLSRYSGETDVVFGATRSCRRSWSVHAASMVGLFINTLPVRVRVSPRARLIPWLADLRTQHVSVRAHEHTPLLRIQEWSEVPRGMPLFHSIVVFENVQLDAVLGARRRERAV